MPIAPDGTNAALAAGEVLGLDQDADHVRYRTGRSPRQQRLDKLWSWYKTEQYAARKVAWDGSAHVGQFERDTIALQGYVPPGFYVAGQETLPIAFRRPTTPYHLTKVIVDRFTSLIFSQRRHPKTTVEADVDTDALLTAVIEDGRLWPTMMQARAFGGATGTAVVGFKLVEGRPYFEMLDPRWCTPTWFDRPNLILASIEYRYPFTHEVRDRDTGKWVEVELWFRRVVDTQNDVIYQPEAIETVEGVEKEPHWKPAQAVRHGFGFCPIVWIQNQPNTTDIDGDPDCVGIYEMVEAMDRLNAQREKALLANMDPTVVVSSNAPMGDIRKGSENALKLLQGDSAAYLEIAAGGIKAASELIADYKSMALEVAQCVLEQPDGVKTATEVDRSYASMLAKADIIREQYGEMGVKRLLNMFIVATKRLLTPVAEGGMIVRRTLSLPKRVVGSAETGDLKVVDHKLGPGPYRVTFSWPPYFEPNVTDAQAAVTTAVAAKVGKVVDAETASRLVAPYFNVEDVPGMLAKIKQEGLGDQEELERRALSGPGDEP